MKQLIILWIGVFAVVFLCVACSEFSTVPADDGGKTDSVLELGTIFGGQSDGSEVESTSGGDEGTSASTKQKKGLGSWVGERGLSGRRMQ